MNGRQKHAFLLTVAQEVWLQLPCGAVVPAVVVRAQGDRICVAWRDHPGLPPRVEWLEGWRAVPVR